MLSQASSHLPLAPPDPHHGEVPRCVRGKGARIKDIVTQEIMLFHKKDVVTYAYISVVPTQQHYRDNLNGQSQESEGSDKPATILMKYIPNNIHSVSVPLGCLKCHSNSTLILKIA